MDQMDQKHGASMGTGAGMRDTRSGGDDPPFTPSGPAKAGGGMYAEMGNERAFFAGKKATSLLNGKKM